MRNTIYGTDEFELQTLSKKDESRKDVKPYIKKYN
jgi:hypothetical protein